MSPLPWGGTGSLPREMVIRYTLRQPMGPAIPGICLFLLITSVSLGQSVRDEESEQYFRKWLDEDVRYIVNPEEKSVFQTLSSPEEKERFIEQFWLRRDPDPRTSINEFKEEHYRRIAYANERFKAGRDGWLTDRGRIYIVFGPPAHIEMHPMGGLHNRPLSEGGGSTTTFPYEVWNYRYIKGLGNDILFEFVDSGMNGNYRLALTPDEKDALLMTGYGLTMDEFFGSRTRLDRIRQQGILRPLDHTGLGINKSNLQRIEDYFKALAPPNIKYKDLQKVVGTRVHYEELPIDTRASIVWVNAEQFMVPATLQIWNRLLTYQPENEIRKARVEIYGAVHDLLGKIVYEFEDQVYVEDTGYRPFVEQGKSLYQHTIPLKSGRYKLDWVVRDVHSGKIGTSVHSIVVPPRPGKELFTSSLILADRIRVQKEADPLEPFATLSGLKVYPNLQKNTFPAGERVGLYFEIYNFSVDAATGEADLKIPLRVLDREGRVVQEIRLDHVGLTYLGERASASTHLYIDGVGDYRAEISVQDLISGQTKDMSIRFRIQDNSG